MEVKEMRLMDHLEEVRKRIIIILICFLLFLCAAFVFVEDIYNWIVDSAEQKLTILGPSDILWIYFVIAGSFAIVATTPVAVFQIWRFIEPGLKQDEKRVVFFFIPALLLCFAIGFSFGYFVLFPNVLSFLGTLVADQMNTMYTVDKYFKFLFNLTLPLGFLFEMPIVIMFLTRLGVLNPVRLAKTRKVAYVVLTVVSTLVTPPDFVSAIIVLVPLLLLFEFSITVSKIIYKKRGEESLEATG
ncbi:twin-arginine translocase subunit TatC [Priestia abyssalis]|uniref:twin-arginine translocase subunit TatC n=1 Tax=Priestia abyssalis TaxID=1221450 RepID=UPI0009958F07|nr:twin-arginine translocase subunit TatC [Priestia abyssalis]